MMSTTSPPSIIGTQTIALQHFTSILPELGKVFSIVELVTIATTFANAIASTKGKILIWKLIMYLQIVKGFLFDNPKSRSLLVEAVVIWIKPQFGRFDEYTQTQPGDTEAARDAARVSWLESIRLSVTVVAIMLDKLQQSFQDTVNGKTYKHSLTMSFAEAIKRGHLKPAGVDTQGNKVYRVDVTWRAGDNCSLSLYAR